MNRALIYGLLTLLFAALAIAMAAMPGVAPSTEVGVLLLVGVLILLGAYERYIRAKNAERETAEVPAVEETSDIQTPGDRFERRWDDYRFESMAVAVVAKREGCSVDQAQSLLDRGVWTDDPYAAAYFGDATVSDPPPMPGVVPFLTRQPTREELRQRTIEELARMAGVRGGPQP